ncbi:MAG: hypothetical protein KGL09_01060 [Pseudomonadota bacterium]|jgi:hypothetical protein|nr:hypothetical protein [Pseudomonadota bacterium]
MTRIVPQLMPPAGVVLNHIAQMFAEGRLDEAVSHSRQLMDLVTNLAASGHMKQVNGQWVPQFDGSGAQREATQRARELLQAIPGSAIPTSDSNYPKADPTRGPRRSPT